MCRAVGLPLYGLSPFLVSVVPPVASVVFLPSYKSKGCASSPVSQGSQGGSIPAGALEGVANTSHAAVHPRALARQRVSSSQPPARVASVGGASGVLCVITACILLDT